MLYLFVSDSGEYREMEYPMGEAPTIGSRITLDDVVWERLVSQHQVHVAESLAHVSTKVRPWDPAAPALDHEGCAVFGDKRPARVEIDEFQARTQDRPPEQGGSYAYDL